LEYIKWGEIQGYHKRPTCKGRVRWWDLGNRSLALLHFNYLINDVGKTFEGKIYCSDNFHDIYFENKQKDIEIFLNSSVFWLIQSLILRTNFGGGLGKIQTYELEQILILPLENKETAEFPNIKVRTNIFTEFGFDQNKPIRDQNPNPLPDRKALDDIVFDALGLTEEERKEVYWAVAELVKNRLEKARSV